MRRPPSGRLNPYLRSTTILAVAFIALLCSNTTASAQTSGDPVVDQLGTVTRVFAIRNAKIVQAPGRVLMRGTVVVRAGMIVEVGTNVTIPPDAEVIEGDSLVVYAGFIDCLSSAGVHVPKFPPDAPKPPRPGEPPRALAGILPDRDVRPFFTLADSDVDSLRSLGFTVAHVVPTGGMLPGTGSIVALGDDSLRAVILPQVSLMSAFAVANDIYPATSMAIMATWRNLYRRAEQTRRSDDAFRRNPQGRTRPSRDPVIDAFIPVVEGTRRVFFITEDLLQLERAIRLRRELGFQIVVAGLKDPRDAVDIVRRESLPVVLSLDLPRDRTNQDNDDSSSVGPTDTTAAPPGTVLDERRIQDYRDVERERQLLEREKRSAQRLIYTLPSDMMRSSVPFTFGTSGARTSEIRSNLRAVVRMGLSPDRALSALTVDAARLLGLERSMGTVENGKIANLVVTDGDYFDDSSRIRLVVVDGVRYTIDRGDSKLEGRERQRGGARREMMTQEEKQLPQVTDTMVANETLRSRANVAERGTLLIRNGTVLTVTKGTLEGTDVLVRDGKIAAIGKDLQAPSNGIVIDATGKWVMPGIIDAHSHLGIDDVNEWTNPVTAEVSVGDVLDPFDINMYRALAGGVTISHAMHGSANAIGGQCQTIKHRYGISDPWGLIMEGAPRTIKFALGENPTRVHGRGNGVHPSTRMGVEQIFRDAFTQARAYMEARKRFQERGGTDASVVDPPYDHRMETLAAILRGEIIVNCHSYRADEILMLMRVFKDFGIKRLVFQHVNEGFKVAPEIADFGAGASVFADWWAYKIEVYYSTAYNASILTRNGVTTSINSDSPELIRHLNHEASKTMRYGGLSRDEALALITINPARQLGIDARVGSLEVGKDADIAIFSAMPLSVYSVCQMTIVDGVVRFDAANDPDDMRMRIDPRAPVASATIWSADEDECMDGVHNVSEEGVR